MDYATNFPLVPASGINKERINTDAIATAQPESSSRPLIIY